MPLVLVIVLSGVLLAAPSTFDERFRAGLLDLQNGNLQSAESNLRAAAELSPGNGRVWVALARTQWRLHQSDAANTAAHRAASVGGRDPVVMQSLAIYYFEVAQPLLQRERFGEVVNILTGAKKDGVRTSQIELALGVAFYGLRRFDEAAAAFLETIALDPGVEQPYQFLGKMLEQIPGRLPEVTRKFAEFESANPASATGYLLHAKALDAQGGEPDVAGKLLEKSIAIDGNNAAAHLELGLLLERTQRLPEAAKELERAIALEPSDPVIHYRLARIYERLGRPRDAEAQRELHRRLVKAQDTAR